MSMKHAAAVTVAAFAAALAAVFAS